MSKNENEIEEIAKRYFVSKNQFNLEGFSSGEIDYDNPFYIYCHSVEIAFQKLDYDERLIINNDFFYNAYFGWWKIVFTKTEYQKIKRTAIKKFLRYFNEN